MEERKIKVLIAKPGLDGHDRGAKVVATALKEAGMEVIYTGRFKRPEEIVSLALKEKVDVIGLSILSGTHMYWSREVVRKLKEEGANIPVILGGIVLDEEIPILKNEVGIAEVFPPGSKLGDIVKCVEELAKARK
ncbi:MAG: methylmalonyl-CoA mutase [Candidatus Hecatellales archaeon]|nr:MAG: methylmalonyl-CoA mutase [Candidatus Hecatellales archaeon]